MTSPEHTPVAVRIGAIQLLFVMAAFMVAGMVFLYLIGVDALEEKHPFQFFSDSNTYHRTYAGEAESFEGDVISINANYLGPLLILSLVGGNPFLVLVINVVVYYLSILTITTLLRLEPLKVGVLLLLSPMTISSLLSVNKEIFIFPFIACALAGHMRRSLLAVGCALVLSILARWQLTAFYLVVLCLSASPVRIFKRRGTVLLFMLAIASIMYLLMQQWIEPVMAAVELSIETYDEGGSGLFEQLLEYQKQGLYLVIFPFKALHLLFASAIRLQQAFDIDNIYNNFFVASHCAVTLLVCSRLVLKGAFRLRSDLIFASMLFLVVFSLSPIYAPRYLYAVFVIWVLVLAGAPQTLRMPRRRVAHLPPQTLLVDGTAP